MNARITMQTHAENYLSERRRLGYGLRTTGYSVLSFARYIDALNSQKPLTVEVMADWARQDKDNSVKPSTWARRLKHLRSFCRYLQQFEPRTEVPDDTVFGRIGQRLAPHIYSEQEIIDLKSGTLTIRKTKFAKSRHVLLHASTIEALQRYRALRNSHVEVTDDTPFFIGTRGRHLGHGLDLRQVHRVFIGLRDQLGWINRGAHNGPRIHDLRHTFVVRRVLLWQTQGLDVDQHMLALSIYVGHTNVTNTYWYLTGIPQLMAVAAEKCEAFTQMPGVSHD